MVSHSSLTKSKSMLSYLRIFVLRGKIHPDGIPQVVIVRSVHSLKRQWKDDAREGQLSAATGKEAAGKEEVLSISQRSRVLVDYDADNMTPHDDGGKLRKRRKTRGIQQGAARYRNRRSGPPTRQGSG
jgi:hypothetical protein